VSLFLHRSLKRDVYELQFPPATPKVHFLCWALIVKRAQVK